MEKTVRVNRDKKKLGTISKCSYMQKILPVARITFLLKKNRSQSLTTMIDSRFGFLVQWTSFYYMKTVYRILH